MPPPRNSTSPGTFAWIRKYARLMVLGALLLAAVLIWLVLRGGQAGGGEGATFTARRGPLDITVLQGGSAQALESQEVKCEVRAGQGVKILKIVDEGYQVTEEDIRTRKVLVELDSADLQKQIVQQDIQYEQAASSLIDAQQNYEIQLNQNQSDLKSAEQKVRFARMDFDKFLGDKVTQEIIDQLGLEKALAVEETTVDERLAAVEASGTTRPDTRPAFPASQAGAVAPPTAVFSATNPTTAGADPSELGPPAVVIDFSKYADINVLGDGEAKQKLRKFEDDLQVARKEEGQAKSTLDGTRRLFAKSFVTKIDLERDELAAENNRLKVQTAQTARDLFLKYEFFKSAEEALNKHSEAVRELVRARKAAVSKLAQARARLKSAQGQFNIQSRQKKDLYEQLDKCVLTARKSGLVVYGGGRDDMYGGEERIREGATVRERQTILTIPDVTRMSVRVKIHESYIKKIKKGLKVRITADAFPDKVLEGEVSNVGVLPDSQNRWMNPDMNVYLTTITIHGAQDWLKPGMSTKVEIIVNRLADVVYVPVQAVSPYNGQRVCYVANGGKPERRVVEVGEFNDEFIELKSGLREGEKVLLRPAGKSPAEETEDGKKQPPADKAPPQPAAPPTATVLPANKA